MYRAIEGAYYDEFEQAAGPETAPEKFEIWHRTIVSENTFPRLLVNPDSPWWDDVRTEGVESALVLGLALIKAYEDLEIALGPDPETPGAMTGSTPPPTGTP